MKKNRQLSLAELSLLGLTALLIFPFMATSSQAQSQRFYCGQLNGEPTTYMDTPRQQIPLVQWLTSAFGSRWTPENRCDHVSAEFQKAAQAKENYLTIGKANGYDIICSASVAGGSCQRQLLTIPKNRDPIASLDTLNRIKNGATSAVLLNSPHIRSNYTSYSDGWNGELRPYWNLSEVRRLYDN